MGLSVDCYACVRFSAGVMVVFASFMASVTLTTATRTQKHWRLIQQRRPCLNIYKRFQRCLLLPDTVYT